MVEQLVVEFALAQLFIRILVRLLLMEQYSRRAKKHDRNPCEDDSSRGVALSAYGNAGDWMDD